MYNVRNLNLKPQRNFYSRSRKETTNSETVFKSNINVAFENELKASCSHGNYHYGLNDQDYYKNYEYDEIPVKEFGIKNLHSTKSGKVTITDSDLDKLEMSVNNNASEELRLDVKATGSLESNIKFFRTTVQEIFDNFYASMKDFELYKKRFHDILKKNREESLEDMEDFIKDIIAHIMASESNVTSKSKSTEIFQITYDPSESGATPSNISVKGNIESDENLTNIYRNFNKDDALNIFFVSSDPCVEIKMNSSNLLSGINIKRSMKDYPKKEVASADNLKRLAAKKAELENYDNEIHESKTSEIEIPVKVSNPKKNIHLDEDFVQCSDDAKSLITKICTYLCKKIRKTALG